MAKQLIFTSARRGLEPGQSGYCTVARHRDLRERLVPELERFSSYHHLNHRQGEQVLNPVVHAYRVVSLGDTRYHIFTRIVDCGTDYSNRSNYLAHHLVAEEREMPAKLIPAEVFLAWKGWKDRWDAEPTYFGPGDEVSLVGLSESLGEILPAKTWAELAGDAGAAACALDPQGRQNFSFFYRPEHADKLLHLFRESAFLTSQGERLRLTFTTFLQGADRAADFRWAGCWAGVQTPAASARTLIDVSKPGLVAAPDGAVTTRAREGDRPKLAATPVATPRTGLTLAKQSNSKPVTAPLPSRAPIRPTSRLISIEDGDKPKSQVWRWGGLGLACFLVIATALWFLWPRSEEVGPTSSAAYAPPQIPQLPAATLEQIPSTQRPAEKIHKLASDPVKESATADPNYDVSYPGAATSNNAPNLNAGSLDAPTSAPQQVFIVIADEKSLARRATAPLLPQPMLADITSEAATIEMRSALGSWSAARPTKIQDESYKIGELDFYKTGELSFVPLKSTHFLRSGNLTNIILTSPGEWIDKPLLPNQPIIKANGDLDAALPKVDIWDPAKRSYVPAILVFTFTSNRAELTNQKRLKIDNGLGPEFSDATHFAQNAVAFEGGRARILLSLNADAKNPPRYGRREDITRQLGHLSSQKTEEATKARDKAAAAIRAVATAPEVTGHKELIALTGYTRPRTVHLLDELSNEPFVTSTSNANARKLLLRWIGGDAISNLGLEPTVDSLEKFYSFIEQLESKITSATSQKEALTKFRAWIGGSKRDNNAFDSLNTRLDEILANGEFRRLKRAEAERETKIAVDALEIADASNQLLTLLDDLANRRNGSISIEVQLPDLSRILFLQIK